MQKTLKRYFPIFVVPTLIAFAFAFIIPFIEGVYLSFCKFTTVGNAHWVGLENYKAALTSQDFTYSLGNGSVYRNLRNYRECICILHCIVIN